jgi:small conductance mechanosensitive channel
MKYTDKYAELIIPWLLTSGIKIVYHYRFFNSK